MLDPVAELIACRECGKGSLLQVADLCADCIARIGTAADDANYRAWRAENEGCPWGVRSGPARLGPTRRMLMSTAVR